MNPVNSFDVVSGLIKRIKGLGREYNTNFFPDQSKIELWIKLGIFEYEDFGETAFLFKKNNGFRNLFFISDGTAALSENLENLAGKYPGEIFVADVIGKKALIHNTVEALLSKGFFQYTSLLRMSRILTNKIPDEVQSLNISQASEAQAAEINDLLRKFFDPYAEQLPLIEEILSWINNNSLLIYSDDHRTIQGFVIFELIGQTSYLRYWFVHPEHRDKKIGSALLRNFFSESRNTRRQLFWVIESNSNAIKRYIHYGYKPEDLFDIVLINKNIRYEGKDS